MVATNYSTVRNNFKGYCDMATDQGETVLVTRKDDRNIVIMSLDAYNAMTKEIRNRISYSADWAQQMTTHHISNIAILM